MSKTHNVIIIPGLGDQKKPFEWATNHWRTHGLEPLVYSVGWRDGQKSFIPKLHRLLEVIDRFVEKGDMVSLVGASAGGSAALNAFAQRKTAVQRVINICGRLRVGNAMGFRSLRIQSMSSPAFAESVTLCERHSELLSEKDRKKCMTVRAMFGDELVPPETTVLRGAHNIQVPTPEHMFSIFLALTIFSKPLIGFLKQQE